jgi:hypothetical protein
MLQKSIAFKAKIEFFQSLRRWCAFCFCFRAMKKPAKQATKSEICRGFFVFDQCAKWLHQKSFDLRWELETRAGFERYSVTQIGSFLVSIAARDNLRLKM